jgi:hypothetical protein
MIYAANLTNHDNQKVIFFNFILFQGTFIFQTLPIENQQLMAPRIAILSLYLFNILFHVHNLMENCNSWQNMETIILNVKKSSQT